MKSTIALCLVAAVVPALAATPLERAVFARQDTKLSCSDVGEKPCGNACIPLTYTCCPDQKGGCPATSVCQLGDNKVYGCCPVGKTCNGDATVTTNTLTLSRTNTLTDSVTQTLTNTDDTVPTDTASETETGTATDEPQPTLTDTVTPSASLPGGTITSVPVPTGGNGTAAPPTTSTTAVITAGAATHGLSAMGGLLAGIAAFLF
ncbi:hypothetical protein JDV02_000554 [Purpureocillium takamizusanense]|uniref:GPI anchored serine-threonine rich protein n=1 Tax=Purpureocillium takamizusanense TaxID=2060973 RepID=A0A9Q8Q710_9HYPO|nr:uncharacterized protein JDV02_000554 [Purpureocillium takamizusanense]UNI13856.1 hypothetical protein JDV02_000554 [Purpureocillium takamizusanense]